MAHGGYARRRPEQRRPLAAASGRRAKAPRKKPQVRVVSLKNQIRSTERLLRKKDISAEVKAAQEKKLEDLKKQQEIQNQLANERKVQLRDRKIKFIERRRIERRIRRLEKRQRSSADNATNAMISSQLSDLRNDLEYVRFFPKNEKYIPLFSGSDASNAAKRNQWRKKIQDNLSAAAASGKDLEETASDDDVLDLSDDDFFMSASSSDEEADDEWTDKSTKEHASSASGRAASGMSSDDKYQRQASARVLMPPPRSLQPSRGRLAGKFPASTSSYTSNSTSDSSSKNLRPSYNVQVQGDHNSNLSSNSDVQKPRRKRKHRKKRKQA